MIGVSGRIQREGDVVHVIAYKLFDLSATLRSVGGRDAAAGGLAMKSRDFR
jgi:error-prone DNA polymerase